MVETLRGEYFAVCPTCQYRSKPFSDKPKARAAMKQHATSARHRRAALRRSLR